MEAFKKWWRKFWVTNMCRGSLDKIPARLAWRGALKIILKKMNENKFMANGELRSWIEKELED